MIEHIVSAVLERVWDRKPGFLTAVVMTLISIGAMVFYLEVIRGRRAGAVVPRPA